MIKQNNNLGLVPTPPHIVTLMINLILTAKKLWDSKKSSNLFVIDNSVGDGRFLFEFADSWSNVTKKDTAITLHGLDINQESIDGCKTHQGRFSYNPSIQLSFKTGNAIIGNIKSEEEKVEDGLIPISTTPFHYSKEWPLPNEKDGYDICVGNPPFGLNFTLEEKKYFKQKYRSVDPEVESYLLFVERSVELLRDRGLLVLLIPNNFTTNYRYREFRTFLLKKMDIQKIIMLTDNVFPEVAVETCILMGYKNSSSIKGRKQLIEFSEYSRKVGFTKIQKCHQDQLYDQENRFLVPLKGSKYEEILETIDRNSIPLGEIVNISRGIELGFHSDLTSENKNPSQVPLVAGRNIHKLFIDEKIRYINFDRNQRRIFKDFELYTQPKIFLRRIGHRLTAAYDPHNLFCVCDVYILTLRPKWSHLNLRYLEIILNSSLLTFYLNQRFLTVKKLFPKIPINYLRQLPVKIPLDPSNQNLMKNFLVRLDKFKQQEDRKKIMEEMDYFIYKINNLTENQILILETSKKENFRSTTLSVEDL
ncbi:MAG: TaqI-like C-terminal specificity domain-containing protein [Candidatus Hodarchaeales archaeon]